MSDEKVKALESMIARAAKLVAELENVYANDLQNQHVSLDALNITHEVIEKCSNVLDQAMTLLYEREIEPKILVKPTRGGYFPAARDEGAFRSTLGQWKAKDLDVISPEVYDRLRSLQPFVDQANEVFARIRELASKKHSSLAPQKRQEQKRVSVTRPGAGSVSWGPGVTFGQGVSVMGVPVDPRTQMPAHTNGIKVGVEIWVSFHFEDGGEDALSFCKLAVEAVSRGLRTLFPNTLTAT